MWLSALPLTAIILLIVLGPGLLLSRILGISWISALGFSPLAGVGLIAVSGIACDTLGFSWTPQYLLLSLLFMLLLAAALATGLRRLRVPLSAPTAPGAHRMTWWWIAAGVLSATLLIADTTAMVGSAESFSQSWDAIHHLNLTQWMTTHHQATTLYNSMDGVSAYYPVAWHQIASQALMIAGSTDVPLATNAMILATVAIFWPLSMLTLLSSLFRPGRTAILVSAILLTGFTAYPHLDVWYGVLYPNLLALALAPSLLAVGTSLLGLGAGVTYPVGSAWLLLLVGTASVSLAHPSVTVMLLCVLGSVMVTFWALSPFLSKLRKGALTGRSWARLVVLAVWLLGAYLTFHKLRPGPQGWDAKRTLVEASIEGVLVSPLDTRPYWPGIAFLIMGVIGVLWLKRFGWLLAAHLALVAFWVVAAAESMGYWRIYLLAPWYGDAYRLAAFLPLTAVPLATWGAIWVVQGGKRLLSRSAFLSRTAVLNGIEATFILFIAVTTQLGGAHAKAVSDSLASYSNGEGSRLVSVDELSLMQQIEEIVPEDEAIAVNPHDGSSMVFALTGREVTEHHAGRDATPEVQVLIDGLDQLNTNPEICRVLGDLGVRWVLDFNDGTYISDDPTPYPGWADIARTDGFELRAREGDASLYEITGCD